jgi:hypothetical protein
MYSDDSVRLDSASSRENSSMPMVQRAVPTIGNNLYRPLRLISRPEPIELVSTPAISGSSSRPDLVALAPLTTWKRVAGTRSPRTSPGPG